MYISVGLFFLVRFHKSKECIATKVLRSNTRFIQPLLSHPLAYTSTFSFFLLFLRNEGVRNFFFFFLFSLWASPIFSAVVMVISTVSAVLTLSLDTLRLSSSSSSSSPKWFLPFVTASMETQTVKSTICSVFFARITCLPVGRPLPC